MQQNTPHQDHHQQPHFYQPIIQNAGLLGMQGQPFQSYNNQFYQPHLFAQPQQTNNHHHAYLPLPYPTPYDYYQMQTNSMPTGNNLMF